MSRKTLTRVLVVGEGVNCTRFPTWKDLTRLLAAGTDDADRLTAAGFSHAEIKKMLCPALTAAYPQKGGGWIVDVYDDRCIASGDDDKTYEVPYAIVDSKIVLGTSVEVRKQVDYIKVQAAAQLSAAVGETTDADYGSRWRVQINEAGIDKQKIADYPLAVLTAAAPLYEGSRVFALSQAQHDNPANPYGKSVRDLVGWMSDVAANATGLEGTLNILKSAAWLKDMIGDAWARGKKDIVGLSHDVLAATMPGTNPKKVEKIVKVDSVDVVYDPIAGGKILRMAAAYQAGRKEEGMLEKLLAALKTKSADLYKSIEAKITDKTITEDEVIALLASATGDTKDTKDLDQRIQAAVKAAGDAGGAEMRQLLEQSRITACGLTLKDELRESGLPDLSQARVKKQFDGKVFDVTALQAAVNDEKEYLDKLTGAGIVSGAGGVRVGAEEPEKLQAAFDKLMGVTVDEKFKDVAALTSLRAAYVHLTGDTDVRGVPTQNGLKIGEAMMQMMRMPAAYSTASFTYVLGNSMYRRLIQDYRAVDYGEQALISYKRNAKDFKTMESINVGYFGDLPDVDPESGDYAEITMANDEEISYALNQKGIILTVNRKVIINDDLKSVQVLVSRLGRAAKRTFAERGWAKINSNATYKGDSTALFDASHGNLGSVALTADATGVTTLTNRLVAMFNQTEKDSGKCLCLEPAKIWVPRALLETARLLNSSWPGAAAPNSHAGLFGANHENILVNKSATDTTDWGLIGNPAEVELLEVAFLNGQEVPELFVADNPLVGQMFVADKIQYKQRHEYEWEIADYRGFDKSVVAGG